MTSLLILHYTEDRDVWNGIASTATIESLGHLLTALGFEISSLEDGPYLRRYTVTRSDTSGPREVSLNQDGKILQLEHVDSVAYYAALLRWMRGHLPEDLPLNVVDEGGSPFFEVDFDNLEDQILREIPMS